MALVVADRVKETTTTAGTGTVTLLGASIGYQSFAAIGNGNETYYTIAGQTSNEWEVGIGTYTSSGTTLSRTTVLASSNSGSLVNFSAGTKDVFVTYPANRAIYTDTKNSISGPNNPGNPALATQSEAIVFGYGAYATDATKADSVAIGSFASSTVNWGTAVGHGSSVTGTSGSAFGYGAVVTAANSTAVGPNAYVANAAHTNSTALGNGATTTAANQMVFGNSSVTSNVFYGTVSSPQVNATNGIVVNSATVTANYTIPSGSNAMSAGPVTISSGVAVTVSGGSIWTVI